MPDDHGSVREKNGHSMAADQRVCAEDHLTGDDQNVVKDVKRPIRKSVSM
jgi:hypothetical protein